MGQVDKSRRQFLSMSAAAAMGAAGAAFFPLRSADLALGARRSRDHFLIFVVLQGGADSSYLFDGRPLSFTHAGLLQNYLGQEPILHQGLNGQACWRSSATEALRPYLSDLTVMNGVVMAAGFDGHVQNANTLIAGTPFGGESFLPHLNHGAGSSTILDSVMFGDVFADLTNMGKSVPLDPTSSRKIRESLALLPPIDLRDPVFQFVRTRLGQIGAGIGDVSRGARAMDSALPDIADLAESLKTSEPPADPGLPPIAQTLAIAVQLFRRNVISGAVLAPDFGLDTHASDAARQAKSRFEAVSEYLANILSYLKGTPFDSSQSCLDVTTLVVSSEFSRTMRQKGMSVEATGTDHNPLSNSLLLAGCGIRGGLVLGASDWQNPQEAISGAHLTLDRDRLKLMGKPFDFEKMEPRSDLPAQFRQQDYLTVHSIVNSIYSCFGLPASYYRRVSQGGEAYPLLRSVLRGVT